MRSTHSPNVSATSSLSGTASSAASFGVTADRPPVPAGWPVGVHPAASLFPMLHGVALGELAADIELNGLREPIVVYQGLVIDGRNRLRGCELAGIEPRFIEWNGQGSLIGFVLSRNLHRPRPVFILLSQGRIDVVIDAAKERPSRRTEVRLGSGGGWAILARSNAPHATRRRRNGDDNRRERPNASGPFSCGPSAARRPVGGRCRARRRDAPRADFRQRPGRLEDLAAASRLDIGGGRRPGG